MSQLIHFYLPFDVICDVCEAQIPYNQKFKARKEVREQGVVVRFRCPGCTVELMFLQVGERCYETFRGCSRAVPKAASAGDLEVQRESDVQEEVYSVSDLDLSKLPNYIP